MVRCVLRWFSVGIQHISFGKIDKFGWTLVVDVAGLDHAIVIQFSGVARSWYLDMRLGRSYTLKTLILS